ncbi:hypothetical protein ACA910_000579 [Epithemia clementina (nom. ined.)]
MSGTAKSGGSNSNNGSGGGSTGGGGGGGGSSTSSSHHKTFRSEVTAIWEMNSKQVENWVRLSLQKLTPPQLVDIVPPPSSAPTTSSGGSSSTTAKSSSPSSSSTTTNNNKAGGLSSSQQRQQHEYFHMALWKNVSQALDSLKMVPIVPPKKEEEEKEKDDGDDEEEDDEDRDEEDEDEEDDEEEEEARRARKRAKRSHGRNNNNNSKRKQPPQLKKRAPPIRYNRQDPYLVWLHAPPPEMDETDVDGPTDPSEIGEDEDVFPETMGGRLAQLGVAGFVNAFALVQKGYVKTKNISEPKDEASRSKTLLQFKMPSGNEISLSALQVYRMAVTWHRVIQAKVRADILVTTPLRIQDMLAADLTAQEFSSIRKRIYDTVILGKGIHVNDGDDNDETLATAQTTSGPVLEIEKFKKCPTCGNNDQSAFVLDRKNGDVICSNCGTVVSESLMHEGSQYRKFEGEIDRNHHGDTANPLLSNAHNMSTTLSGVSQSSGAGMGGWRSGGGGRNLETILRNAHDYIELNVSQLGKTDRRTRVGYKDRQKKDAFSQMGHVGDALSLHEAVVQRAKELFAGFRDDRELVQQFKGVIAACLCEAFEQLSTAGHSIMKGDDANNKGSNKGGGGGGGDAAAAAAFGAGYSARAARRNELHHAKLAGKGGLLLDFSNVSTVTQDHHHPKATPTSSDAAKADSPSAAAAVQNALEEAPAATWDLEHCRTWLLEASRRIAQQWVEERSKGTAAAKRLPIGTLEELEGQLVEHTFTLCEQLEDEIQARSNSNNNNNNSKTANGRGGGAAAAGAAAGGVAAKRVITPRINEMGKLGIKWQHSHERGSGGKGGVGGSGTTPAAAASASRTAGQSLILKTAKKLGSMLNDSVAGEAIHKELRGVVARQEARKLKDQRLEASRQRMQQMKRKAYLLARVQSET